MSVEIQKETAKDLILSKISHLQEEIKKILLNWNIDNLDDFISKAKTGEIEDAEMDAITIRQLNADYLKYKKLLNSLSLEE